MRERVRRDRRGRLGDAGSALLALGNEQEAYSFGIEEHAVVGGVVGVALGHLDGGDGRAAERQLVDGGDGGGDDDDVGIIAHESARADGDDGAGDAVELDGPRDFQNRRIGRTLILGAIDHPGYRAAGQPIGERPERHSHQGHPPLAHDGVGQAVDREGAHDGLDGAAAVGRIHERHVGAHAQHAVSQRAGQHRRLRGAGSISRFSIGGHSCHDRGASRRLLGNGRRGRPGNRQGDAGQGKGQRTDERGDRGSHCDLLLPAKRSFPLRRSPCCAFGEAESGMRRASTTVRQNARLHEILVRLLFARTRILKGRCPLHSLFAQRAWHER